MNRTIAYLTSWYARAGDTFIRREVAELRRRGWTVHTFSIRRPDEGESVSEDIRQEQRATDYIVEHGVGRLVQSFLRLSLRHPRRMFEAIRQVRDIRWPGAKSLIWHAAYLLEASYLAEQMIKRNCSWLHDHISMNSATVALLASTLSEVPFSMTIHGPHDFFAADHWALGRKVAASAMTVCISDFGKSQCMLFTAPEHWHKIQVVRCGLDGEFLNKPIQPQPDGLRFVCVGRLSPEKGQVLLVDAAARLREQGFEIEVVLIGDGPSRGLVESRARELGAQKKVQLLGWQGSHEVRRWISESRVTVLPSFAEGIPVVLMEAMALGRPVIATYVGGVPELVQPGDNGWLVPAGSVGDLTEAMREALDTPVNQLQQMGERGRRRVCERHDVFEETRKLAELFERAISGGAPNRTS